MKKLIIGLALIISALSTSAQIWRPGVKTIVETNFNPSKVVAVKDVELKSSLSFDYGLTYVFYYNLNSYYNHNVNGVLVELLYTRNHQSFEMKDTSGINCDFYSNNLEIPFMWHTRNQDWGLYGEFGFNYSRSLSQSIVGDFKSIPLEFYKNNFYGLMGAGFDNELFRRKVILTLGLRAYYPLFDMTKETGYKSTHILRTGFVIGFSYNFNSYHHNMH